MISAWTTLGVTASLDVTDNLHATFFANVTWSAPTVVIPAGMVLVVKTFNNLVMAGSGTVFF